MQDYKDKTLQLLDRTLSLRGVPATRGGVAVDYTARRQAAASIMAVVLVVLVLASLSPHHPIVAPASAPPAHDTAAGPVVMPDGAPPDTAAAPRDITAAPAQAAGSPQLRIFLGTATPPPTRFVGPAPGSVPPPAPVWMDGPWRFNPALRNKR